MRDNQRSAHAHLPAQGIQLKIAPAHPIDEGLEDPFGGLFVDISVEDAHAVMTLGHFLTDPEGSESQDEESRPTLEMTVYAGWVGRWSTTISRKAALAIHAFFEATDLRLNLRGAEALREFESADVRAIRDDEVAAVLETWLETVAEA